MRSKISTSFIALCSVLFSCFFVYTAQAESDARHVTDDVITIDGTFSDWDGIDPFITDDVDITGTTYYWNGLSWNTTEVGTTLATTNPEKQLDLINMNMVHSDQNVYVKMQFAQNLFTMSLTDAGKQAFSQQLGVPVSAISTVLPYLSSVPAPANFDHSMVVNFDTDKDGDYEYYLVFHFTWNQGDNMGTLTQSGMSGASPIQITGSLYAESDVDGGSFSDASTETLLHTFDATEMNVAPDLVNNSATVEMESSIEVLFGETDLGWNDNVFVRFDSHSAQVDASSPLDYTFTGAAKSYITGAGPTGSPHVRAFDDSGVVESTPNNLFAYGSTYRGGVRVAAGDIDRDGVDEIVTGTGENGGPHLRVFEKDGTQRGIEFFPFDKNFRGGMDVATGDFDGDGKDDIAVSQFSKGQGWVKVYRYNSDRTILFEKNVFGAYECGATVAMGDLDRDGRDELVVGAGNGCSSRIFSFDYNANKVEGNEKPIVFYAFDQSVKTGIDVSAGDVDGDGKAEIAASKLRDAVSEVKIFRYNNTQTVLADFSPYGNARVGSNVELVDLSGDGIAEIITGAGPGGGPQVTQWSYNNGVVGSGSQFFAYDSRFRGGVDVTGGGF